MQTYPNMKTNLLALGMGLALICPARGDFNPIPLTPGSFTHDVIVEKTAPAPLNTRVTATMDGGTNNNGSTWFEQGYVSTVPYAGLPPQGSTFTATNDVNHVFKMAADYTANNALLVYTNGSPSGTLTFSPAAAYSQLSALVASGGGAVSNLIYTIHYQGGATEDWYLAGLRLVQHR